MAAALRWLTSPTRLVRLSRRCIFRRLLPWLVLVVSVFVITQQIASSLLTRHPWLILVFGGLIGVLTVAFVMVHMFWHWQRPSRRMIRLIRQIRQGTVPIDQINQLGGGLRPAVPLLRELFHDLRTQQAKISELEDDMRRRVATRTEALERRIGTLHQQAVRDPLTGLHNRRLFDQSVQPLLERARSQKSDLAVLMIDVDYFKNLNDTRGHAAGDELLAGLGQLIRSTIRQDDQAFRFGGDEFAILLPGCRRPAAEGLARRLESLFGALAQQSHVTPAPALSIGICTLAELPSADLPDLIAAADQALYEVKFRRKDTVRKAVAG